MRVYLAVLAVEVTQRLETLRLNNAHLREHLLLLTQLTLHTRNSTQRHALRYDTTRYSNVRSKADIQVTSIYRTESKTEKVE